MEVRLGMQMETFRSKVLEIYCKIVRIDSRNTNFFIELGYLNNFMKELSTGLYKTRKSVSYYININQHLDYYNFGINIT